MKRIAILALLVASTLAATPPGSSQAGNPMPPAQPGPPPMTGTSPAGGAPSAAPNAAMLARAQAAFAQLQSGTVDRGALDEQMNAALTDDKIRTVKEALGGLGAPATFVEVRNGSQGGYPYAVYLVTFPNGTKLDFIFAVDAKGKIAGMQLTAPQ